MTTETPLLEVENLTTKFRTDEGKLTAVDGIDFTVEEGETVCIVGESGSGKTVATESITGLVEQPPGYVEGTARYRGEDLLSMNSERLREIRGEEIAHIFQNPQEAMNHCYSVGWQIAEALKIHDNNISDSEARSKAVDLLDRAGIANASSRIDDYPHEFSGGQKQRAMIAMALVTSPTLLIADEPTTALDVTIQAQILRLIDDIQEEFGMSILFVTHDLGVVAEIADKVIVMYSGKVMERGDVFDIFETPAHPYTQALMKCIPGQGNSGGGIPGTLPDPHNQPDGCRFASRCEHAVEDCQVGEQPEDIAIGTEHSVSCIYYQNGYDSSVVRDPDLEQGDGRSDPDQTGVTGGD
ncbi:ABC transporter ATP-binding protein [Halovenus salina]|uniref:Nickel import system ATP-binding protein NikD n=1 Tax=Halovenus salina TaxID=1510225 RepID=A0ABD5W000_9EURY|nr:ABC transporter ATP-binding protein [Halovenus salina]